MPTDPKLQAHARLIKKLLDQNQQMAGRMAALEDHLREALSRPRSPTEMIDAIPGRHIESVLSGTVDFDINSNHQKGTPITIQVSQDGPFVMTHYPMVLWSVTAPNTATDFGIWRPVSTFPLPTQVVSTDIIDLLYEIIDGGAQRNFQNNPRGPLFSRPDALQPLPMPTLWAPNSTIQFVPTYQNISFGGSTPATAGRLHVDLPGYRIVNL
jgi:hypothetical protein